MPVDLRKKEPVYCKNCIRWYLTGDDQCEVPACGMTEASNEYHSAIGLKKPMVDLAGQEFFRKHSNYVHFKSEKKLYGHPTQLNRNNDCYFYKPLPRPLRFLTSFVRHFYS